MRKSTFINIGQDHYKISLDKDDIRRLFPWELELIKVHHNQSFHEEGLNAYSEILLIALSKHYPGITRDSLEEKYTLFELDRAVVEVILFKRKSLDDIVGHGPLIGNN